MIEQFRFYSFLATLVSIVAMFVASCVLAWAGKSVESLGISGAIAGLLGVAGMLAGTRPKDPVEKP